MSQATTVPGSDASLGHSAATSDIATRPETHLQARKAALIASAVAAPVALGTGIGLLTGSRRTGLIVGGVSAVVLAALRWQLQRWFTQQPAYEVEGRIGALEIRRYAPRVEARTLLGNQSFEQDLDEGFRRLARYIFGGNASATATSEQLEMTTPVLMTAIETPRTNAFVMPVGRTLASLPRPHDPKIELVEVPAQRIAVLRFRGRYDNDVVREQVDRASHLVEDAGLVARGEPMFAGFDPPSTLPFLRRTEIWIELA
ncbi:MAG TPA: heme-binding protein [Kofleriaceae bacterium]|nr:heme-binding protein [Kofleriaceae bacterium]